jgi:hypothetical protein
VQRTRSSPVRRRTPPSFGSTATGMQTTPSWRASKSAESTTSIRTATTLQCSTSDRSRQEQWLDTTRSLPAIPEKLGMVASTVPVKVLLRMSTMPEGRRTTSTAARRSRSDLLGCTLSAEDKLVGRSRPIRQHLWRCRPSRRSQRNRSHRPRHKQGQEGIGPAQRWAIELLRDPTVLIDEV